ncbi:hypothetical protein N658DRAFT_181890 [Parathielavia hyrcaniae]|uniref:Uncharacterized protein n=1 Tax=Parathielavia hyrcaniae TaxID=113614 RepID=A0AAN6QBQ3_9PEZI|nr:hypothetical protein N658DRAFT_181890 [Parathielavia hyrcaniae]
MPLTIDRHHDTLRLPGNLPPPTSLPRPYLPGCRPLGLRYRGKREERENGSANRGHGGRKDRITETSASFLHAGPAVLCERLARLTYSTGHGHPSKPVPSMSVGSRSEGSACRARGSACQQRRRRRDLLTPPMPSRHANQCTHHGLARRNPLREAGHHAAPTRLSPHAKA